VPERTAAEWYALRAGTPPAAIEGVASPELMMRCRGRLRIPMVTGISQCQSGPRLMSSAGLDRTPRTRHICGYEGRCGTAAKEGIARCHL
jgi:hypothetical protein